MRKFRNSLKHVRVAAPCPADWNAMLGDDRVRFCGMCSLNVYNLSDMTRTEAESLISKTEGRLCIRYYQRADGSVITNNCPVGLRKISRRLGRTARAFASAALGFCAGIGINFGLAAFGVGDDMASRYPTVMGTIAQRPIKENIGEISPPVNSDLKNTMHVTQMMGRMAVVPRGDKSPKVLNSLPTGSR